MTRRLSIVAVLVCALTGADAAIANTGPGNPGEPYQVTVQASLTVQRPPVGLISGGGINCGPSANPCTVDLDYQRDCSPTPLPNDDECDAGTPAVVTLTASGGANNFEPLWGSCDSVDGQKRCVETVEGHENVSFGWKDIGKPNMPVVTAPSRINSLSKFTASATDPETGISEMRFYIDNQLWEPGLGSPWTTSPPIGPPTHVHGSTHTLKVIAVDDYNNWSSDLASAPAHTYTIDLNAAFTSFSTSPSLTRCASPYEACAQPHVAAPPTFTFVPPGDAIQVFCITSPANGRSLSIQQQEQLFDGDCTSGHVPPIFADSPGTPTWDGPWRTTIGVRDGLNSEEYVYEYVLDRRGPSINLFSPQEGSYVSAPFTLNITGSDQTPPSVYRCDLGSGFGSCAGTHDPPEGPTTLRIESEDALGNKRSLERHFVYDKTAPAVNITSGPAEGAFTDSGSVTFGWTATDAVGPLTTTCKIDQGEFGACSGANSHSTNLNPGIHRFTLRVADAAGHQTVVERQFVVPQATGGNTTVVNNTTANTTTGGAVGGAAGGQVESPAPLAAAARAVPRWSVRGGKTQVKRLVLNGLVKGAKIQVSCKGKGCAFKTKKLTAGGATADLTKLFKKRALAARSRIDIRVAFGDGSVRTIRYTTQRGKAKPKVSDRTG